MNHSRGYIPGLDGLRAFAVMAVVWHHTHPGYAAWPISMKGFLGVDIFFVLSGYLITTLLLRERASSGAISLKQFYIRRTLRIFPLYYAVLALLSLYFFVSNSSEANGFFQGLPYDLTYTSNWNDAPSMMSLTWSLSTEEQFYLLWPPLLLLLGRWSLVGLAAALLLNQAINFGWLDDSLARLGVPYAEYEILQCTFTPIILGVLLAFGLQHARIVAAARRLLSGPLLIAIVVVLLALANTEGDVRGLPRLLFHVLTAVLLAGVVLLPQSALVRVLELKPLAYVGTISYGIYLLHKLGVEVAQRALAAAGFEAPEWVFAASLGLTIVIATISFRFFESPLLELKDRFRPAASTTARSEAAAATSS